MRLERISRAQPACPRAIAVRSRHVFGEDLPRHRHAAAYAAVVLRGSYVEAGDFGRHRLSAGDVVIHDPFEGHLNRFASASAEVLNIPLPARAGRSAVARVDDADAIAKLAELDLAAAADLLLSSASLRACIHEDWPDRLAADLLRNPDLNLGEWAAAANLHPGTLSRGFKQQFAVAPAAFRLNARGRMALETLGKMPLSEVAMLAGFADQAHMSRTLRRMTGLPPAKLRDLLCACAANSNRGRR